MADVPINQTGQGSSAERRLRDAGQCSAVRGQAAPFAKVRPVRTPAYRYLEEATHLDRPVEVSEVYGAHDTQTAGGNGTSSSGVCEKQWADDRAIVTRALARVSAYSEKAWLSRAERAARFKFTSD